MLLEASETTLELEEKKEAAVDAYICNVDIGIKLQRRSISDASDS